MVHLTNDFLKETLSDLRAKYNDKENIFYLYGLSCEALFLTFGKEWTNRNLINKQKFIKSKNFFRAYSNKEIDRWMLADRVISAAETIFNLQDVDGFIDRLEKAKNDDIESLVAEIEVGKILFQRGIEFKYIIPFGKKTKDYDLECKIDNTLYCGEIKCKTEDKEITLNSLINTIKKCKEQLPKESKSIIFIKLTEQFDKNENSPQIVDEALSKTIDRSAREVYVIFFWEKWSVNNGQALKAIVIKEKSSILKAEYKAILENDYILRFFKLKNKNWFYFKDLI